MAAPRRRKRRPPKPIPWPRRASRWQQQAAAWTRPRTPLLQLLGLIFLAPLIAINLMFWLATLPQHHLPPTACADPSLAVSVRYPRYVTVNGENFIELALHNRDTQPISGTAVIAFGGDLAVHPGPSKSNVLSFTALPPDGIVAGQIRFRLNEPFTRLWGKLPFTIQVAGDRFCKTGEFASLNLTPFSRLGTVLSGALGLTLTGLLGGQIKNWLSPGKKD